jgi:hypothetical protein
MHEKSESKDTSTERVTISLDSEEQQALAGSLYRAQMQAAYFQGCRDSLSYVLMFTLALIFTVRIFGVNRAG